MQSCLLNGKEFAGNGKPALGFRDGRSVRKHWLHQIDASARSSSQVLVSIVSAFATSKPVGVGCDAKFDIGDYGGTALAQFYRVPFSPTERSRLRRHSNLT